MTEEVMKIWDALSVDEQDELREKATLRNGISTSGTILANIWLHSDKESMADRGEELGLSESAVNTFCRTGYEVEVGVAIDKATGQATAHSFMGVRLENEVKI